MQATKIQSCSSLFVDFPDIMLPIRKASTQVRVNSVKFNLIRAKLRNDEPPAEKYS